MDSQKLYIIIKIQNSLKRLNLRMNTAEDQVGHLKDNKKINHLKFKAKRQNDEAEKN